MTTERTERFLARFPMGLPFLEGGRDFVIVSYPGNGGAYFDLDHKIEAIMGSPQADATGYDIEEDRRDLYFEIFNGDKALKDAEQQLLRLKALLGSEFGFEQYIK